MGVATSVCEPWSVVFDSVLPLGLAKQGINVVVHYLSSEQEAKQVVTEAKTFGVRADCIKADLCN